MNPVFADISSHQAGADIAAHVAGGADRILLKATEGTRYVNPHFARWWREAGMRGMARGAYHYAKPGASAGGADEATHFANALRTAGFGPRDWVVLDTEDPAERGEAAARHAVAFCWRMVELDFPAGHVYSYTPYLRETGLTAAMLPPGWRWLHIANYNPVADADVPLPPGWTRAHVVARQYTSTARQAGIPGGSDANRVVREWLPGDHAATPPEEDGVMTDQDLERIAEKVSAVVMADLTRLMRHASSGTRPDGTPRRLADMKHGSGAEALGIGVLGIQELREVVARMERIMLAGTPDPAP